MKKDIATMKHSGPMKNRDCHRTMGSLNVCLKKENVFTAGAVDLEGSESVIALSTGPERAGHGTDGGNRRPPFSRNIHSGVLVFGPEVVPVFERLLHRNVPVVDAAFLD